MNVKTMTVALDDHDSIRFEIKNRKFVIDVYGNGSIYIARQCAGAEYKLISNGKYHISLKKVHIYA